VGGFSAMAEFADRFAIPVVQHKPRYLSLPSSHPMNLGYDPARYVGESDLILAIETDVPWIPEHGEPRPDCRVIQCGFDPLFSHVPIRGFPSTLGITGGTVGILQALTTALEGRMSERRIEARRQRVQDEAAKLSAEGEAVRKASSARHPLSMAWVSHCISEVKPDEAIVLNEYALQLDHCRFERADSYFGSSSASGLGWGAGAALGAKLAAPDRPVIAILGDGAYMFSNPVAVHHAAALHQLPVLFVVMNNSRWQAVHRSTVAMYPEGRVAANGSAPFIRLDELPAFEQICAAAGGYGERVETSDVLPSALKRALTCVQDERRQALLNVICAA
jgi:acetolactate synthase-1/2/3 large subunit